MKDSLTIRDPIHGDMKFSIEEKEVIGHELFQRLRFLTQNGLLHFVYPGMRHTRFEHSLGVSFVAKSWFDQIINRSRNWKSPKNQTLADGTIIDFQKTVALLKDLNTKPSTEFWKNVVGVAGLLHDVGHGPLSHTFEDLNLLKLENFIDDSMGDPFLSRFFVEKKKKDAHFEHEDLSLLYCIQIAKNSQNSFWQERFKVEKVKKPGGDSLKLAPPHLIGSLISKNFRKFLKENFKAKELEVVELLSPIVSGLCDSDRLDYSLRDSQHAGVSYGNIELRRIITSLSPILTRSLVEDQKNEAMSAAIILNSRNVHTLDHFLVGNFELWTQVIQHPVAAVMAEMVRKLVGKLCEKQSYPLNDLTIEKHRKLTEDAFFVMLKGSSDIFEKILYRQYKSEGLQICQTYHETPNQPDAEKWECLNKSRRLYKDASARIFIYDKIKVNGKGEVGKVHDWKTVSMVGSRLSDHAHFPNIWWRCPKFFDDLEDLVINKQISSFVKQCLIA